MDRVIIEHDLKMAFDDGYQAGLEAAAPKWTSVDEPPKNTRRVLVSLRGGSYAITYYNPLSEMWDFNHDYRITHWMPLPEPPKEVHPSV